MSANTIKIIKFRYKPDGITDDGEIYTMQIDISDKASSFFTQQALFLENSKKFPRECALFIPNLERFVTPPPPKEKDEIDMSSVKTLNETDVYELKNCFTFSEKIFKDLEENLVKLKELIQENNDENSKKDKTLIGSSLAKQKTFADHPVVKLFKKLFFLCQNYFSIDFFAEEFISMNGIPLILEIIENSEGNSRSGALKAFINLLDYQNACAYVKDNSKTIFGKFYEILVTAKQQSVLQQMLICIRIFLSYNELTGEDFLEAFYEAGRNFQLNNEAKVRAGTPLFSEFIDLLKDPTSEVQEGTLNLINLMLQKITNKNKRARLLAYFLEAHLKETLDVVEQQNVSEKVKALLKDFQVQNKIILSNSAFEVEQLKLKISKYENFVASLEKKAEYIVHNQKFYDELVADFVYFKNLSESCAEAASYYEPYTPFERYDDRINRYITVDKNGLLNLKNLIQSTHKDEEISTMQKNINILKEEKAQLQEDYNLLMDKFKEFQNKKDDYMMEDDMDIDDLREENRILMQNVQKLQEVLSGKTTNPELELTDREIEIQRRINLKISRLEGAKFYGLYHDPRSINIELLGTGITPSSGAPSATPSGTNNPNIPPVPGTGIPPVPGTGIPPVPGTGIPPVPGTGIPPVPGTGIPPVPGSGIPPVPGSGIPPVPGSGIPPVPGSGIPPVPGSGIPPVPGIPPTPGSGVPPIPGAPFAFPVVKKIEPTKKKIKLQKKCKPLNWKRILITPDSGTTLWNKLKEQSLKVEEIEDLFALKPAAVKKEEGKDGKTGKPEIVTFLNPKRAQSVGITIAKLPAVSQVSMALQSMDESLLTEANIESLNRESILPEEIEEYKKYSDPNTKFGKSETYLIGLYIIKNSAEKFAIWNFLNNYDEEKESITKMLDNTNEAIKIISDHKFIPLIFSYVMSVGNILNGGTDKGQADGFQIEILPKLSQIKDKNGQTVLKYICKKIKEQEPDFEDISKKFAVVKEAFAFPFCELSKTWSTLKKGYQKQQQNYNKLEVEDGFKKKAGDRLEKLKKEIETNDKRLEKTLERYHEMAKYFSIGEKDPLYNQPELLFKLFTNFFEDIDKSLPAKPKTKKPFIRRHEIGARVVIQNKS